MLLDDRKEEGNSADDMQVDGHEEPVTEDANPHAQAQKHTS